MENQNPKVIFDTNIWISFLIRGSFNEIISYISKERCKMILSEELLLEIFKTLAKRKFRKILKSNIVTLERFFIKYGTTIDVTSKVNLCRDPADNFLLALALDSKADFLVTGDKDLLVLENIKGTQIVSYSSFISKIIEK